MNQSPLGPIKLFVTFLFALILSSCQPETMSRTFERSDLRTSEKPMMHVPDPAHSVMRGLPEEEKPRRRVALLLPLTGLHMGLGQSMLAAAQVRYFDIGAPEFDLILKDTKGTPEHACKAFKEALSEKVDLILGPVFSSEVEAIKGMKEESLVPIITFSNTPQVLGQGIYTVGHLPSTYAQRVLDYARSQKISNADVVIVLPKNSYGEVLERDIKDFEIKEADVPTSLHYQILFYDLKQDKYLYHLAEQIKRKNPKILFIPEGGPALSKALEALVYHDYDLSKVQLLGTYGWIMDQPPLVLKSPFWEEAIIAAPNPENRVYFMKKYEDLFKKKPSHLTTLAYDSISIAAEVMGALPPLQSSFQEKPSYQEITSLLLGMPFYTTEGILQFQESGSHKRELCLLRIRKGGVSLVDADPQNVLSQMRINATAPLVQ